MPYYIVNAKTLQGLRVPLRVSERTIGLLKSKSHQDSLRRNKSGRVLVKLPVRMHASFEPLGGYKVIAAVREEDIWTARYSLWPWKDGGGAIWVTRSDIV